MGRDGRAGFSAAAVLLIACVLVPGMAAPRAASASTWSNFQLPGEAAKVTLFGASCPTISLCVVVGGNNTVATSTNPTGGAAGWSVAYVGEGAIPTEPNETYMGNQIRGVSCPSPTLCVAVSFEGLIYSSTNPTGGNAAWSTVDLDPGGPNTHLYGISCPTANFCAASAKDGKIVTSTNPTGGVSAWTTTQLQEPLELRGISCVSASLCVAVGNSESNNLFALGSGEQGAIFSSTNPLGGAWQRDAAPIQGPGYGVFCPTAALCVSGDLFGNLLVSNSPDGGPWRSIDGGGSVQITAVDCISALRCVAIDNNGDVLTSTDPDSGPAAWTFTNVVPYTDPSEGKFQANAMFGVSCPSTSLCVIAANKGQIFTSADTFTVPKPDPENKGKGGKKNHRKGPKRPRTIIAARPFPGIPTTRHKISARFRFFAQHRVQVRGFVCKMDGRPLKRCHSPKTYSVGLGKHVFRVRAIGSTGLKGPPEIARFQVCRPSATTPFCGR